MRKLAIIAGFIVTLTACAGALRAQEAPCGPPPQKEHEWLQQFTGEWETEAEAIVEPGKPPMKCKGTESVRSFGGYWIVSEIKSTTMPMTGLLTVGYDSQKKKYVGTWIDSMTNHLWKYEGSVDVAGKILTLEAEGPNLMSPGKTCRFRDVTEFKSKDHKVLTSSMQMEDGKWVQFVTINCRRKR